MIVSVTISNSRQHEIADAVRSVVGHVDRVLLLDTGITDDTAAIALEVAGEKLVVAKHEWSDFATARNAALDEARKLGAEWAVIVDSDERLDFTIDLRAALAQARASVLLIESDDGYYPKEKIVRIAAGLRFVGPTHETLSGGVADMLDGATFFELDKSEEQLQTKFRRDIAILTEYVKSHGDEPRWWYYLGGSYEGIGDRERAMESYVRCLDERPRGDEAAWSAYKAAEQLFLLDRYEDAIATAGRGLGANPTYAECAWIAAVAADRLGWTTDAVAWARIAESVGWYKGCGVHRIWFRHLPALYELPYDVLRHSLSDEDQRKQAEIDFHQAKLARLGASDAHALDRLSVSRSAHAPIRNEARCMLRPERLGDLCASARIARISFAPPNRWHPMNPSICLIEGEIRCVIRTVNYTLQGAGRYIVHDPHAVVRTENYLGTVTTNNQFVNFGLMRDLDPGSRKPSSVVGYEDVRLAAIDGRLVASATVCDRDPDRRQIALLDIDPVGNVTRAHVQTGKSWHEKNWMLFEFNDAPAWIYSMDPTTIVVPKTVEDLRIVELNCALALDHLRGGALAKFGKGYLAVTHEVVETIEGRIYLHRFVHLDGCFGVTAVTSAWVFQHHGIEFCAGLVVDGDQLIMSYGVEDREAWIARVPVSEVESMNWITT